MSSSKRQHSRSPTPKIQRYLHRIEQIVGNRSRPTSPLSSRSARPMRTNSLDYYLKYELSFKLLAAFTEKYHQNYLRHFFNVFRVSSPSKVQKIYKFVPIEKTSCAHMVVDSGISVKILANFIKLKLKERLKDGLDMLRAHSKKIMQNFDCNSARKSQGRSRIKIVSRLEVKLLQIVFEKIRARRAADVFHVIQVQASQNHQKLLIFGIKIRLLAKVAQCIQQNNQKSFMARLSSFCLSRMEKQKQGQVQNDTLRRIVQLRRLHHKCSTIQAFLSAARMTKAVQTERGKIQYYKNKEGSKIVAEAQIIKRAQAKIRQLSTLSFVKTLEQACRRRVSDSLLTVRRVDWAKISACKSLYYLLSKRITIIEAEAMASMKIQKAAEQNRLQLPIYKWKTIQTLLNLDKYFLKEPFHLMADLRRKNLSSSNPSFAQFSQREVPSFSYSNQNKSKLSLLENDSKLPRTIYKVYIFKIASAFTKIKLKTAHNKKQSMKSEWSKDINEFIEERNEFYTKSTIKIMKLQDSLTSKSNDTSCALNLSENYIVG